MKQKLRIGILFGGRSAEHEVSIQSAKNIYKALDSNKYEVKVIGISKLGSWHPFIENHIDELDPERIAQLLHSLSTNRGGAAFSSPDMFLKDVDVVFPVLHGPYGEDGTIQGFLKTLDLPFVGAGVLGSALGMDKDVMKRLLRDGGLPIGKFITITKKQKDQVAFDKVAKQVGLPFFIKPANLGSSVGVSKVSSEKEFSKALEEAFRYDSKILAEEYIKGREIECSVLGNDEPIASIVGEIIPQHEFYDYSAKYLDENGATLQIPAKIPEEVLQKVQKLAIQTFQVLCCSGMGRVDFFLTKDEKLYVNEINTLPGFTKISMYPSLWSESGVGYSELLDRLIQLALEKYHEEREL